MQAFPGELSELFNSQFFSFVLPWLLTYAIVYGILSQFGEEDNGKKGVPQNRAARAIIAIVLAFIAAPMLSSYVTALMQMSSGFIIIISAFLVFIVLLEIFGVKKDKDTIFKSYPKFFVFILIVLAIMVFAGSGAPGAMGLDLPSGIVNNYPLLFFLAFMVLMVGWMITESGDDSSKDSNK